jgi:formylglycine-generating enzyme required for sulfatase activity
MLKPILSSLLVLGLTIQTVPATENEGPCNLNVGTSLDWMHCFNQQLKKQQALIKELKVKSNLLEERITTAQPSPVKQTTDATDDGPYFRDRLRNGSKGPEMVWIPAGSVRMGDIQGGGDRDEKPVHEVKIARFAIGSYEVTFAEYDRFAIATRRNKPEDEGYGRGNRPVINVSWEDATAYTAWLSEQTGQKYRLPTEAEWEYAARAGTETKYWWGNEVDFNQANCWNRSCGDSFDFTAAVGSFSPNQFGLYDTVGNVWEWTCSAYDKKYQGNENKCADSGIYFTLRGGSWNSSAWRARAASRLNEGPLNRNNSNGFRIVKIP